MDDNENNIRIMKYHTEIKKNVVYKQPTDKAICYANDIPVTALDDLVTKAKKFIEEETGIKLEHVSLSGQEPFYVTISITRNPFVNKDAAKWRMAVTMFFESMGIRLGVDHIEFEFDKVLYTRINIDNKSFQF